MAAPRLGPALHAGGMGRVTLGELLERPDRVAELAPEDLALTLSHVAALHLSLAGRLREVSPPIPAGAAGDRLLTIAEDLAYTIEENMRLTRIAQAVNRRVMQTFVEVLADQQRVSVYSNQGLHGDAPNITVSLNINEQA